MTNFVVDTNVILAANSQHPELSPACVVTCAKKLQDVMTSGVIVIDDGFEILKEYQKKSNHKGGKRPGDAFLKWLLQNSRNPKFCQQVSITLSGVPDKYVDFPDQILQDEFDPPDRKFVAAAHAHGGGPLILQAADCKWVRWNDRLKASGVSVDYLCPDDICKFYKSKFPDEDIPDF